MRKSLASCRNSKNFPIVIGIALSYALFILLMQYSKHKWVIVRPETLWGYVPILHAEMSLYLLLVAFLVLSKRSTLVAYLFLTLYYVLCLLDNIVWYAFLRPFHYKDFVRGIELIQYYSEFVTAASFGWKRLVYTMVPLMIGSVTLVCGWTSRLQIVKQRLSFLSEYTEKLGKSVFTGILVAMAGYAGLVPMVISGPYLHYNSLFRMGEEIYYEQALARAKMLPSDRKRLFGSSSGLTSNGQTRPYNVIFFILETAPKAIYPDMTPYLGKWAQRNGGSLRILDEHYTPYPESDRSLLSMMSGKYPCLTRGSGWIESYDYANSLPQILERNGYKTHLFSTAPLSFRRDDLMVKNLGFKNAIDSSIVKEAYRARTTKHFQNRTLLYKGDEELLEQALDTIQAQDDNPYLLAFLPQASHAPFQIPPKYTGGKSQLELFEANARWQMELLNRLTKRLEDTKQAERTILIVLGDHGLRHPAESTLFRNPTLLNRLTFGVTLAICCPQQVPPMQQAVTSHVDLTPTVLEMLGIPYNSEDYQGRSMLRQTSRSVFFLGGDYLPASGFTRNGSYFMENRNRNLILESREFDFKHSAANKVRTVKDSVDRATVNQDLCLLKSILLF